MIVALLILHAFVTVAMIGLILLQKSDEAGPLGMGGGGGGNALFTARGVANILTRATSFLAALFIGNCLLIATITNRQMNSSALIIPETTEKRVAVKKEPTRAEETVRESEGSTPSNEGASKEVAVEEKEAAATVAEEPKEDTKAAA